MIFFDAINKIGEQVYEVANTINKDAEIHRQKAIDQTRKTIAISKIIRLSSTVYSGVLLAKLVITPILIGVGSVFLIALAIAINLISHKIIIVSEKKLELLDNGLMQNYPIFSYLLN